METRVERKIREFEAKKKLVRNRIEKVLRNTRSISSASLPEEIARKVEKKINSEKWMQQIIKDRFDAQSEHGSGSRKWKSLSPAYRQWRIKHGFGPRPILHCTGALRYAATAAVARTFRFKGVEWDIESVRVDYAKFVDGPRPFFKEPNAKELKPTMQRVRELIRAELRKLTRG